MALSSDIQRIKDLASAFVIFGATGDLSRKKIVPSFFKLFKDGLLPQNFKIIAAARTKHSTGSFLDVIKPHIKDTDRWNDFEKLIEYIPCDIEAGSNLETVALALDKFEEKSKMCIQRVYYLAVAPNIYEKAFVNLGLHKLNMGCRSHETKARIVVEKPFGYDFESSQKLQATLSNYFGEEQIYRIDHFLGKETVQNIFAFRFGNQIFEPIWNRDYVDNIQITMAEYPGIDKRGHFYEEVGALRDVVQNHLLQLLTLITMEEPEHFNQPSIRSSKLKILDRLKPFSEEDVENQTVRGQYEGYRKEPDVKKDSQTETFASLKIEIENDRWKNVPVYIRTGKRLAGDVTSIIISFKEKRHKIFRHFLEGPTQNHITIQIQPTEGIGIRVTGKKPGLTTSFAPIELEYCYRASPGVPSPGAYERLLMDIIAGDQTLFLGQIGPSWKFIDPIRKVWDKDSPKLAIYKAGSWGPREADELIEKDGRTWLAPLLTICKI